jgi:hypothetical protein
MRTALWVLTALLMSSCTATIPTNYAGTDAGYAAIGIGAATATQYSSYSFLFRRVGEKATGRLVYFQNNMFYSRTPDYKAPDEAGVVEIATLPPGDYELVNFDVFLNAGMVQTNYSSRKEFSIPFQVQSKQVVYLGNYQANAIRGRNIFGMRVAGGAYFVVEDRMSRDLGFAKMRLASLPVDQSRNATPDVKQVGNPFLVSMDQARLAREIVEPTGEPTPAQKRD